MTPQSGAAIARRARAALLGIRSIPSLSERDDAEARRLVAQVDQLTDNFRPQQKTPNAQKAWLRGLRALMVQGSEIERKYRQQ